MASDCIFCDIVSGQTGADFLYRDEYVSAFWDAHPAAPVHILIVPNKHIASVNYAEPEDAEVLGRLILTARKLAKEQGVDERGYRLVFNVGLEGGQSVYHVHLHLIAGRRLPVFHA
jgi:histidine triad (HIT) family protein